MQKIFFIILVFSALGVQAGSEDWFNCSQDSECVKVVSGCGRLGAVNKKYEKIYGEQVRKDLAVQSCLKPSAADIAADKAAEAVCTNKQCILKKPNHK